MQISDSVGIPSMAPGSAGPTTGPLMHLPPENTSSFYLPNRIPYNPSKYLKILLLKQKYVLTHLKDK